MREIKETTILECPKCKKEFLPCYFRYAKCSENECGAYYVFICPECKVKVKPKEYECSDFRPSKE